MSPTAVITSTLVVLSFAATAVLASDRPAVYRCGAAGNVYSDRPCDNGRALDVGDARNAAQVAEARKASAERQRLAIELADARIKAERAYPPQLAGSIGPERGKGQPSSIAGGNAGPGSATRSNKAGAAKADGGHFTAIVPGSGKPPKKKRKSAQTF